MLFLNKFVWSVTILGGAAEWKQGFSSQGSSACAPVSQLQLLVPSWLLGSLGSPELRILAWELCPVGLPSWHLQSLLLSSSMSGAVGVSATYQKDKQFQPFKTLNEKGRAEIIISLIYFKFFLKFCIISSSSWKNIWQTDAVELQNYVRWAKLATNQKWRDNINFVSVMKGGTVKIKPNPDCPYLLL